MISSFPSKETTQGSSFPLFLILSSYYYPCISLQGNKPHGSWKPLGLQKPQVRLSSALCSRPQLRSTTAKMSKSGRKHHLSRVLDAHISGVQETLRVRLCRSLLLIPLLGSSFLFNYASIAVADSRAPGRFGARKGGLVGSRQAGGWGL